ncbi:hypothetical protein ACGFIW_28875 [Micromonospora sp. NPDC048935]|uniref:hypothetical protein n=1 Tax=Micromonospora sp. NPDC048935 TaxID=3364262 RepID=UPI003717B546
MALLWLPRWLRRPVRVERPSGHELFVEWHGSAAVISHGDDPPSLLWRLVRTAVAASDDVLVLTSERAVRSAGCGGVLRGVVEGAAQEWGVGRVWVAASGLGRPDEAYASWLTRLAARTGVELLAPDGPVHATPDGTLYAAGGTGAWGWRSFRPGVSSPVVGNRYPVPSWEPALPDQAVVLPGLVADPVPAGVLLRSSAAAPSTVGDPAYDMPVDRHRPTLLLRHVGEPPPDPRSLAGIFAGLPARTIVRIETALLDPTAPPPRADWVTALAAALDESAAVAEPIAVPEPGQHRRASGQPPPVLNDGWVRASSRLYRHATVPDLLAEVVPSGVLLRTAGARQPDGMAFVDPAEWVLAVDVRDSDRLVDQLCRMLVGAGGAPGLTLVGQAGEPTRVRLEAALRAEAAPRAGLPVDVRATSATGTGRPPVATDGQSSGADQATLAVPLSPRPPTTAAEATSAQAPALVWPPATAHPFVEPAAPARAARRSVEPSVPGRVAHQFVDPAVPGGVAHQFVDPAVPGGVTHQFVDSAVPGGVAHQFVDPAAPAVAARRRVESLPVARRSAAAAEAVPSAGGQPPAHDLTGEPPPPPRPAAGLPPVITSSGPYLGEPERPVVASAPASAGEGALTVSHRGAPTAYPGGSAVHRYAPAVADPVEDRASTAAEQRDLAASLGPAFTDSITTVNAALAAWPALRQGTSASAKTDFVAVHVFFGRSEAGAARLNAGLRAGRAPSLPGYLPCLVSGLRRLPPYRRAMLCQGRVADQARHLYPEGGLLVEPGFRSVSGATDLAVEGADVDYLVWSRTARQAGALADQQDLDEAVFLAGARFKVLAVREGTVAEDRAGIPTTAVLLREVLPDEQSASGLDDADRSALTRLERALIRRRAASPRLLTDAHTIERLLGPPLGYLEEAGASVGAGVD